MFGIGPQYYVHIYLWLITILSLLSFSQYSSFQQSRLDSNEKQSGLSVFILTLFLILFIGLRPVSGRYFVDMAGYYVAYETKIGEPFVFDWNATNKIFDNLLLLYASNSIPVSLFFISLATIYFAGMSWACLKLFPRDKFSSYLVYLGAFSTFSYGTNGMKAGVASSLFLVAVAMFVNRDYLWAALFILLSWGFHHSMVLPIAAFVLCVFVRNPKWYFAFWVFCFFIALFHISFFQDLFASLADDSGAEYLNGSGDHVRADLMGGFRLDFILYSAAPLVVGWIAVYKKKIVSRSYYFLLNLYVLINAVWLLCMYAEFTNRISYLSWLLLPIVLIYPFLNEEWSLSQYRSFEWVALGHMGVTLFMQYLFY